MKWEIGFEEYLEYVEGAPSRFFKSFVWVPIGCLRSWLGMLRGGGMAQECPNCGACKESGVQVLFECASYDSQILIFGLFEEGTFSGCF